MLLLEGAALLVLTAHWCDRRKETSAELVRMLAIVTVGVSALNLAFFANELMDTGDPRANFVEFLINERFSAHIGDVNAAGSFLAMGFVIAAAIAVRGQANRWIFAAAAVAILPALWLTASRAALLAVVVVCAGAAIGFLMTRLRRPAVAVAIGTAGLLVVALTAFAAFPQFFDSRASRAGNIRWMFLQTTARMLQAYPAFGLGVGQYQAWSGRFSSPELREIYASENAHNNFAQVAGELGIIGLAAFLLVLGISLQYRARHDESAGPASRAVMLGVIAFLITCLAGHPLLLPEVSYIFWGALAVAAAGVPALSQPGQATGRGMIAVGALVLLASVGPRVYDKMRVIDFSGVTYGLTNGRFAESHARVFVPDTAAQVTVPVRGRGASANDPLEVDISFDGRRVNTLTIVDRRWQSVHIPLQPAHAGRLQHLDLTIRPARNRDTTRRRDVEIGEPVIIPRPNG
jgi:O-antigen ligase